MRTSILLLFINFFFSCNQHSSNTKEQTTVDTSNIQKTDSAIAENTVPVEEVIKLSPLENSGNLGQIAFSQNNKTIFYFDLKSKEGLINLNRKNYSLNKFNLDNNTGTYTLLGNGVAITAANCKFEENEGSDCNYGSIATVTIKLNKSVVHIKDVEVQDCPDY